MPRNLALNATADWMSVAEEFKVFGHVETIKAIGNHHGACGAIAPTGIPRFRFHTSFLTENEAEFSGVTLFVHSCFVSDKIGN